ncbi:MAG: chromosomal replication initiator protein DnaA [Clostridia bacterium]|nr:chromosomal replication initiator protein DnaA [Clostridia bacterium]
MDSVSDVFDSVMSLIRTDCENSNENMTPVVYNTWLNDLGFSQFEGNTFTLTVPSEFKKNIISEKFGSYLKSKFTQALGFEVDLEFVIQGDAAKAPDSEPEEDEDFTFESFVVGGSNQFAYAACRSVAENPGSAYNPLFIHGRSGVGKTHLLKAIENRIRKTRPEMNVCYVNTESFTNELIKAIQTNRRYQFHEKYRSFDVLLIDDIQFIQISEASQEEIFNTFNELYGSKRQIVFTSDKPPRDLATLDERLKTRFEWGLLADINVPDFSTRVAIINKKADAMDFEIPQDVKEFLASRLQSNIRQLEGAVNNLHARCELMGRSPDMETATLIISDIITENQPVSVRKDKIIRAVADYYNISVDDITGQSRSANVSNARQVAMYALREILGMTLADIGSSLGGRSHATVNYNLSQMDDKIRDDYQFRRSISDLIQNIRSQQ